MNPRLHAVRNGLKRGWTEFVLSLKSPQDQGFFLFMALATLGYLFLRRNTEVEGTTLSYPTLAMPSLLGAMIAFGLVVGPAYSLAMEREDGTVLRSKAAPYGIVGYMSAHIFGNTLGLLPSLAVILIPASFLFDNFMYNGLNGWLTFAWVVVLGLLATLPIGIVIGATVPGVQKVGTWGMLPILVLLGISGIFYPIQDLWDWLEGVAQVFPMYWLGLGMRSAFLPEAAAALEIGGSWRTLQTVAVLAGWAIIGMAVAPRVLRRMSRRQSGSAVEAARLESTQWIR